MPRLINVNSVFIFLVIGINKRRNLLRIIEQIRISPDRSLKSMLQEKNYAETIHGFIRGYRVVDERERAGGIIELELELPLTGSRGLSRTLHF